VTLLIADVREINEGRNVSFCQDKSWARTCSGLVENWFLNWKDLIAPLFDTGTELVRYWWGTGSGPEALHRWWI
jgi:hypothetical protein